MTLPVLAGIASRKKAEQGVMGLRRDTNSAMKAMLVRLYWIFSTQLGVDPRVALRSVRGMSRYLRDLRRYRVGYQGNLSFLPCLQDWHDEGGAVRNEYFWQDLLVARWVFEAQPQRHVDVGSRIDGFVAHVASFRTIEIFDVRPLEVKIPGVTFRQADLMNPVNLPQEYCDSLSCLHALEHFGLGRYGDPIDPQGHEKGLANMARLLKRGGIFYLSVPIGKPRVEFNANRVLDPMDILRIAASSSLSLLFLTIVHSDGVIDEYVPGKAPFQELASVPYTLGIFRFEKN
jgi:SAM-dependent methyltransferase